MNKCLMLVALALLCYGSAGAQNTSLEYLEQGSAAYIARDYKRAIPPYQKALDLEKKERKLSKEFWFVLVDNLAIAYGITGDLKKSMEVLEYGISKEPEYPMFYYNMACGYGEQDDEANALKYLRLAFKYRENMIPGEEFPDPEHDGSFKRLMKKDSFKTAVAELKRRK